MGTYDQSQICLEGHVINDRFKGRPEFNKPFCATCGSETITTCPGCRAPIQGYYHVPGVVSVGFTPTAPKYCQNCGSAFPWTKNRIRAAIELFVEETAPDPEREKQFAADVDHLVRGSTDAPVAVSRLGKFVKSASPAVASGLRDILVNVASERFIKLIFGT